MTDRANELMEEGIRAYTRGDLGEADRCWRGVLAVEPNNARASAYLALLVGEVAAGGAVPLPAPGGRPDPALVQPLEPETGAVPLPAPGARLDRTTLSDYAPSPWDTGPAAAPAVVLDEGVGLDLASVAEQSDIRPLVPEPLAPPAEAGRPRSEVEIWMEGARELFALGDFSGSLEMIEKILKVDPSHAEAREYLQQNEATLIAMYESKLGPVGAVPRLAIKPEEVMWLNLDHRAGFLLAQIDGTVSFEDLFALSGVPRLDTARILASLLQEGVIRS